MLSLEEILLSRELAPFFVDYLRKTMARESLEFWLEVEMYKRAKDSVECLFAAKRIYNKYICANSPSEINLSGAIREQISKKMDGGLWDQDLFEEAQQNIHEMLKLHSIRNFNQLKPKKEKPPKVEEVDGLFQLIDRYRLTVKSEKLTLKTCSLPSNSLPNPLSNTLSNSLSSLPNPSGYSTLNSPDLRRLHLTNKIRSKSIFEHQLNGNLCLPPKSYSDTECSDSSNSDSDKEVSPLSSPIPSERKETGKLRYLVEIEQKYGNLRKSSSAPISKSIVTQ